MAGQLEKLERRLDSFDAAERRRALTELAGMAAAGTIEFALTRPIVNLHCHTFFSYNSRGYSPAGFAYLAKKAGLAVAGIVDFDVLDGVDEFLGTCRLLELKGVAGVETRVFVPEFSERQINSPGEPGVSYHMGVGFGSSDVPPGQRRFLLNLKAMAQQRNRRLVERVNKHLDPVTIDFENDVVPLTPAGNATERHICLAYAKKAAAVCKNTANLVEYWSERLDTNAASLGLPEGKDLINMIRAKTMKYGGAGYIQPDSGSFPTLAETNEFLLSCGAIPTQTWLSGVSEGEQATPELLKVGMATGVAAINVIPHRNYGPGVDPLILENLRRTVRLADELGLVVITGTEMNSPGQIFSDDFDREELRDIAPFFLKGAYIAYAHGVLQRTCGLGYSGGWAKTHFPAPGLRNDFFEQAGRELTPAGEKLLAGLDSDSAPADVLARIAGNRR